MKRVFVNILIHAVLLTIGAIGMSAYSGRYMVTTQDGLSNSSINHILQDSHGLMWIGTWDGLNVYNGSSMRVYRSDPSNSSTLLDNIVWHIVQENERYYWVVTSGGVCRLDSKTELFKRYRLGSGKENSMTLARISMDISESGETFVSSLGWGLAIYDRCGDRMVPFNVSGLSASDVSAIYCNGNNRLIMRMADGRVVSVYYTIMDYGNIVAEVESELISAEEQINYSSRHGGYVYFFGLEKAWRLHVAENRVESLLFPGGSVSYSAMSADGSLYVLAGRDRVYDLDFESGAVCIASELSRGNLLGMCFGTECVTWLAIDGVGLEASYGVDSPLKLLDSRDVFGLNSGSVTSFVQVRNGDIYVSTLGNGLFVLDQYGNFKFKIKDNAVYANQIFSMGHGPGGSLILGSTGSIGVRPVGGGCLIFSDRFKCSRLLSVL